MFKELMINRHFLELWKGAGITFILRIVGMFSSYAFTVLVTKNFGMRTWGLFTLAVTLLQIVSVIGKFGMDMTLLKITAQYASCKQWEIIRKLYFLVLKIEVVWSLLLAVLFYIITPYITEYFYGHEELTYIFRLFLFCFFPFVMLLINREVLRGLKKYLQYSFFQDGSLYIVSSLILFATIHVQETFQFLPFYVYMCAIFLSSTISFLLLGRALLNKNNFSFNVDTYPCLKENVSLISILRESYPFFFSSSILLLMNWTDNIILGLLEKPEMVGMYNVCWKIAMVVLIFSIALNTVSAPKIAELYWTGNYGELLRFTRSLLKLNFVFSFPLVFFIVLFSSQILLFFDLKPQDSQMTLMVLVFARLFHALLGFNADILNMTGNQKIFYKLAFLSILINICLNFILIPELSILGAAIATGISVMFRNFLGILYVRRILAGRRF